MLIAWVMGMPGTMGEITFFYDLSISQRLFTTGVLATMNIGLFLYFKNKIPVRFSSV